MIVLLIQMLVNTSVIHIMILIIVHVILAIDLLVMVEHVMVSNYQVYTSIITYSFSYQKLMSVVKEYPVVTCSVLTLLETITVLVLLVSN